MNATPLHLLVVDDDVDTCRNLQDILSDLGYEVQVVHDGPSALRMVEQQTFDIALLDLKMPGMDGLDLYRELNKRQPALVSIRNLEKPAEACGLAEATGTGAAGRRTAVVAGRR